jgi:hypothetical protein
VSHMTTTQPESAEEQRPRGLTAEQAERAARAWLTQRGHDPDQEVDTDTVAADLGVNRRSITHLKKPQQYAEGGRFPANPFPQPSRTVATHHPLWVRWKPLAWDFQRPGRVGRPRARRET